VDVSSFGKSKKEALRNLEEAVDLYFEDTPISHAEKIERRSVSVESLAYA
jgi:predicted RNase H-like HicB family nuclease